MAFIEIVKAVILGVIQGITEWLPVSSTGHMILVDEFLKLQMSDRFKEMFMVVVQFGSILAVVLLYFKKLNPFSREKRRQERRDTLTLWYKVLVAAVPAGIVGLLLDDWVDTLFYNAPTVAAMLIVYGVGFLLVENARHAPKIKSFQSLSYKTAFLIGGFQVLALIPGTSRSGATILGAVLLGTSRTVAAEFSFFLAVPMMLGASCLKLLKAGFSFSGFEWLVLGAGVLSAFIVSLFAIRFLMQYIQKHDFKAFGYYRIVLGIVVIAYFTLFGA